MTITNYFLAKPSAAPTVSTTTAGSIQLAHRRVNPDGTYTAPSPILTNIVLPNTATPQAYSVPGDLARDEFLVSNDGGLTWRIVPRATAPFTGAQSIPAFNSAWAIASLADTQESAATAVDFGTFLAGDSDTKTIWIINRLQTITSLSFSVLDLLNNLTDALNNILEISITGITPDSGTGVLNTSFNATKIYSRQVLGSGLFTLTSSNPSAIRIELQLVNYPLTGLSENIDYQLSIVPNPVSSAPTTLNPVRVGRIISSIDSTGLASGYVQDSDGLYVYLTTDTPNTIGSPTSGSDIAESWTNKLFDLVWNLYSTAIFNSDGSASTKGASASADYSANKRLQLPDLRDRVVAGRSTSNPLGSLAGSDTTTLSVAQLPSHTHSIASSGSHTHSISLTTGVESNGHIHGSGAGGFFVGAPSPTTGSFNIVTATGTAHMLTGATGGISASHTHGVSGSTASGGSHTHTASSTGSGDPIDTRQSTTYVHKLISTGY